MTTNNRSIYAVAQMRAEDIQPHDVVRVMGEWRDVLAVYHDMKDLEDDFDADSIPQLRAYIRGGTTSMRIVQSKLDTGVYVALRVSNPERSIDGEIADLIVAISSIDLVDVQILSN